MRRTRRAQRVRRERRRLTRLYASATDRAALAGMCTIRGGEPARVARQSADERRLRAFDRALAFVGWARAHGWQVAGA